MASHEGIFRSKASTDYEIDSAATSSWEEGNAPHPGTQKILLDRNISTRGMRSRKISDHDFEYYDYIIGMDKNNVRDLYHFSPEQYHHKIKLFLNSVDGYEGMDVPDPWYTGDFDTTERLVDLGTSSWLKIIDNE